jgi:hypothetical protein
LDPSYKLDVDGDINISSTSTLRVGGTPAVFSNWSVDGSDIYRSSGNVGIGGAASGTNRLKVHGTVEATAFSVGGTGLANSATITASDSAGNSTIVQRNSDGYVFANFFNTTPDDVGSGVTKVCVEVANDGYIRHGTQAAVRSFLGLGDYAYKGNGSNITRTSHSNGFLVGSYNSVGANSTKTNPIYTIGSSYNPTDTSFGDMYGIGYTHGNFTSILTGGWGMYVAADGDARIGLNGTHGHIKCTGYVDAGSYVDAGTELYVQNWIRTRGNTGHYWEASSNGNGWHIYPKDRTDMYFRTGVSNGGIAGTIGDATTRGYIHWTTSNEIGFLSNIRHWSLRMDSAKNCTVYGVNYSGGYNGRSDTRMKKNIVHADDTTALNLIREIKPRIYEYIDTPRRGTHSVYGFIAQEIKALIPKAVTIHEGEIPNIYQNATFDKEQMIITFENFDTGNLHQTKDIICMVDNDNEKHLSIKSVLNSKQIEIEDDDEFKALLEESEIADEIFVWGQTVDDFHYVDKNYIFTVATAALQEVDRQLQTTRTELAEERTQLRNTQTELDVVKIKLLNIEARMQIIESNISKVVV